MFGLFRSKKTKDSTATSTFPSKTNTTNKTAPGTQLYYDPQLIMSLKQDHAELLEIWGSMGESVERQDIKTLRYLLDQFKTRLNDHLLTENLKLYVYLSRTLQANKQKYEVIHSFRKEMRTIGSTVTTFLRDYTDPLIKETQLSEFKSQFDAIGGALVDRISREESDLYSLYIQQNH